MVVSHCSVSQVLNQVSGTKKIMLPEQRLKCVRTKQGGHG